MFINTLSLRLSLTTLFLLDSLFIILTSLICKIDKQVDGNVMVSADKTAHGQQSVMAAADMTAHRGT